MARTLAREDLRQAAEYHAERRSCGLVALDGPAAPWTYRLAYSLFGFATAEKLAARRRAASAG
jgi:hypothetical protein